MEAPEDKKRSAEEPAVADKTAKKVKAAKDEAATAPAIASDNEVKMMLATVKSESIKAIRKAAISNPRKKPYSTVTVVIPSKEFGIKLLGDVKGTVKTSNNNTERRLLNGQEIAAWLGIAEVDKVKFTAKQWTGPGFPGITHVTVFLEEADVKITHKVMTVTYRSYMKE